MLQIQVIKNVSTPPEIKTVTTEWPRLNDTRDCNPGPFFPIPGFGIEEFLIPGSGDPGGIRQFARILAFHYTADLSVV